MALHALLGAGEGGFTLGKLMTEFGTFFSGLLSNVGAVIEVIVSNPILLIGVLFSFSGAVFGIVRRLRG